MRNTVEHNVCMYVYACEREKERKNKKLFTIICRLFVVKLASLPAVDIKF